MTRSLKVTLLSVPAVVALTMAAAPVMSAAPQTAAPAASSGLPTGSPASARSGAPVPPAAIASAPAASAATPPRQAATAGRSVERGAYLVRIMGCNHCHTPYKLGPAGPEPDMSRALSGHPSELEMPKAPALGDSPWVWIGAGSNTAFAGPWGVSFTANLTPDPETGLGRWSPETFIAAMKTGRHEGKGRPILPPMPVENLATLTDSDIRDLFAYLLSLPPVRNRVPAPVEPAE